MYKTLKTKHKRVLKKNKKTSKRHKKTQNKRKIKYNRRNKTRKGGFFYNKCPKDLNPNNVTSLEEAHSIYQQCCPSTNLGFMKIKNKTSVCKKLYKRANEIVKQKNDEIENPVMDVNKDVQMPQPTPDSNNMDQNQGYGYVPLNDNDEMPEVEMPEVQMHDPTQPGPSTLSKLKGYFSKK